MAQWLWLHVPNAGLMGSIPGWCHLLHGAANKKERKSTISAYDSFFTLTNIAWITETAGVSWPVESVQVGERGRAECQTQQRENAKRQGLGGEREWGRVTQTKFTTFTVLGGRACPEQISSEWMSLQNRVWKPSQCWAQHQQYPRIATELMN